jgi:hypothetical protein
MGQRHHQLVMIVTGGAIPLLGAVRSETVLSARPRRCTVHAETVPTARPRHYTVHPETVRTAHPHHCTGRLGLDLTLIVGPLRLYMDLDPETSRPIAVAVVAAPSMTAPLSMDRAEEDRITMMIHQEDITMIVQIAIETQE